MGFSHNKYTLLARYPLPVLAAYTALQVLSVCHEHFVKPV